MQMIPVLSSMRLPDRVAFQLGSVTVYWAGVCLAAGILAALLVLSAACKRKSLLQDTAIDLCLVLIPCGVVGARLFYVLTHLAQYRQSFGSVFRLWDGGLSAVGAVVLGAIGLILYAWKKKIVLWKLLDVLALAAAALRALSVWGNFFEQTGYGRIVGDAAQKWFPLAVRIEPMNTIHYALFFYTFLLCVLLYLVLRFAVEPNAKCDGTVFLWYALIGSLGHVLIEIASGSARTVLGIFTTVQIVCIVLAILAAALLCVRRGKAQTGEDRVKASAASQEQACLPLSLMHRPAQKGGFRRAKILPRATRWK